MDRSASANHGQILADPSMEQPQLFIAMLLLPTLHCISTSSDSDKCMCCLQHAREAVKRANPRLEACYASVLDSRAHG